MSPVVKAVVGLVVQVALVGFGLYLGIAGDALPGATPLARMGIAALFVGVAMLFLEIQKVRMHMGMLLTALQAQAGPPAPRDRRMAVDVLVSALASADPEVRATAHRNLVRVTGQDLPADAEAWRAWWQGAREGFGPGRPAGE